MDSVDAVEDDYVYGTTTIEEVTKRLLALGETPESADQLIADWDEIEDTEAEELEDEEDEE